MLWVGELSEDPFWRVVVSSQMLMQKMACKSEVHGLSLHQALSAIAIQHQAASQPPATAPAAAAASSYCHSDCFFMAGQSEVHSLRLHQALSVIAKNLENVSIQNLIFQIIPSFHGEG